MATSAGEAGITRGTTDESYGYFENLDIDKEPKNKAEVPDGVGNTVRIDYSEVPWKVKGTYIFRTTTGTQPWTVVGTGTPMTFLDGDLAGKNVYIDKAGKTKAAGVEGYHKCSFEGTYHPNLV